MSRCFSPIMRKLFKPPSRYSCPQVSACVNGKTAHTEFVIILAFSLQLCTLMRRTQQCRRHRLHWTSLPSIRPSAMTQVSGVLGHKIRHEWRTNLSWYALNARFCSQMHPMSSSAVPHALVEAAAMGVGTDDFLVKAIVFMLSVGSMTALETM